MTKYLEHNIVVREAQGSLISHREWVVDWGELKALQYKLNWKVRPGDGNSKLFLIMAPFLKALERNENREGISGCWAPLQVKGKKKTSKISNMVLSFWHQLYKCSLYCQKYHKDFTIEHGWKKKKACIPSAIILHMLGILSGFENTDSCPWEVHCSVESVFSLPLPINWLSHTQSPKFRRNIYFL